MKNVHIKWMKYTAVPQAQIFKVLSILGMLNKLYHLQIYTSLMSYMSKLQILQNENTLHL